MYQFSECNFIILNEVKLKEKDGMHLWASELGGGKVDVDLKAVE